MRRTGRILHSSTILATCLVLTSISLPLAANAAQAATCVSWTGLQPPNPGTTENYLYGAAVLSPCSAWAVGKYASGGTFQTLILRWRGSSWKKASTPNPGTGDNILADVAAVSSSTAWAVGGFNNGTAFQTLILRWDGANWTKTSSPNPAGSSLENFIEGVNAISSTNAWAVGDYNNSTARQTLTLHWNGTKWRRIPSPNPGGSTHENALLDVTATSPTNAWAVGEYSDGIAAQSLILHWNGTKWGRVPSPNPGGLSHDTRLIGVAAASSSNAWAVGFYNNGTAFRTLILHWNGTKWTKVPSPDPGSNNTLSGIAALSGANAWAGGASDASTLLVHWNGNQWTRVSSPSPGTSNEVRDVAASSASNVWGVGSFQSLTGPGAQALAIHCC